MGNVKSGKAGLKRQKTVTKKMLVVRETPHGFINGWTELRCGACGLSRSNPVHDLRNPPGVN